MATFFRTFYLALTRAFSQNGGAGTGGQEDEYIPSLEFDDGRNSQFIHIIGI